MITGNDVGYLLGGGAAAATIAMGGFHFFGKKEVRKIEPQPLVVTGVEKFVVVEQLHSTLKSYSTLQDMNDLEHRIGEKITDSFKELDSKRSNDIGTLHEKVNATQQIVAALNERTQGQTAMLALMDQKLTNLVRRDC